MDRAELTGSVSSGMYSVGALFEIQSHSAALGGKVYSVVEGISVRGSNE